MNTTIEMIKTLKVQSAFVTAGGHIIAGKAMSLAAQRLRELDKPDCEWTFDEDQGLYHAGCGEAWMFSEASRLAEHVVKFCQFCGGAVKEST